ncbi:L-rhamnose mutarotase [Fulvitalea axinellae]
MENITATDIKTYYQVLDLKDDPALIAEYEKYHEKLWPEITEGIKSVGILDMRIYRTGNRMMMVMEVPAGFDFDTQMAKLGTLPRQEEWEELMWKYQQPLPFAAKGQKWMPMEKIFELEK